MTTWALPLLLLALGLALDRVPRRVRVGRRVIRACLRGASQTLGVVAVFVVVGLGAAVACSPSDEAMDRCRVLCRDRGGLELVEVDPILGERCDCADGSTKWRHWGARLPAAPAGGEGE